MGANCPKPFLQNGLRHNSGLQCQDLFTQALESHCLANGSYHDPNFDESCTLKAFCEPNWGIL